MMRFQILLQNEYNCKTKVEQINKILEEVCKKGCVLNLEITTSAQKDILIEVNFT